MTSCARTVWNQSRLPSDTQQAAAEEVQRSCSRLHTVFRWKVFTIDDWTTIQLAERRGLCANRNQEATHWSQLQQSATHALNIQQIVYGVKMGMTELIFVNLWGEGSCLTDTGIERTYVWIKYCLTLFIHKTICCLWLNLPFFVFCDFPR